MARPSIVPIALTLDDRTGYTLWAPPWEEDGEEWQAFLGGTEDETSVVHLFPTPGALAAFCRTNTDHDLADHPVWRVVAGLAAADITPDDDHRYDLDGVYDVLAEDPDRWAVEDLAATFDVVGRLAEVCADDEDEDDDNDGDDGDDDSGFESVAELMATDEVALLRLGIEAFLGRTGAESWIRLGGAVDELWEDIVEELEEHLDWTGAGTVRVEDYPSAAVEAEARGTGASNDEPDDAEDDGDADDDGETANSEPVLPARAFDRVPAGSTALPAEVATRPVPAGAGGSRLTASVAAVAAAAEFWEAVGILPVEIVVPDGAGFTLRCYVEDEARFLGRDGEVFLFGTPTELAAFTTGDEAHDLTEIASWAEVADTDTLPLPVEQDRYDLTELAAVLTEVAGGAAGLVDHRVFAQPVDGVRDLAEYAGVDEVDRLLSRGTPLGRAVARSEREPGAALRPEDAAALTAPWAEVVAAVSGALVFRD